MSEGKTAGARRRDTAIAGGVLVFALVGGGAFSTAMLRGPEAAAPLEDPERSAGQDAPETRGPVPDLPEVPDLRAGPPGREGTPRARAGASTDAREEHVAADEGAADEGVGPVEPGSALAALGDEMRLLQRAREQLAEHPAEALAALDEHRRAYPQGALREEREAYTIEALLATGEREAAERRFYDFERSFPGSNAIARLRSKLR